MTTTTDCQNFVNENLSTTALNLNHEDSGPMDVVSDTCEDAISMGDGMEEEKTERKGFEEEEEDGAVETDENGQPVYLKALYDYEYNYDNGDKVTMTTGDIYELKSKVSCDWWQVRYVKDDTSFHVPARYVQILENYDPEFDGIAPPPVNPESESETETTTMTTTSTTTTSNENENKDQDINQNLEETVSKVPDPQPCDNHDPNGSEAEDRTPCEISSPILFETPDPKSSEIHCISIDKHRKQPAPVAPSARSEFCKPTYLRTLSSSDSSAPYFSSGSPTSKNFNSFSFGSNNVPDNCIQVVVGNSENLLPSMRVGGCSTFGKGQPSNWRSDRPKSYHCGGQTSYLTNSTDSFLSYKNVEPVNDYMNLDEIRSCMKDKSETSSLENIPLKVSLTSPSSDEYQNVGIIQASIKSGAPKMDNCKHLRKYIGSWDIYVDNTTKHTFYYNKESHKTTWKPPRPEHAPPDIPEVNIMHADESSKDQHVQLPAGWKIDVANNGETVFIHSSSKDKWRKNVDNNGRQYYYKEGSEESCWDLPELDDVTDLESERSGSTMVKSMTLQPQSSSKPFPQRSKTLPQMSSIGIEKPGSFTPERHQSPTPSILSTLKDKATFLNKTKVMENGKKVSKKWSQSYVKLFGSNIAFYRDQRAAAQVSGSKNGNPEMIFNLQNAKCELAPKEWSSKKNVFMLTDNQGTQLLLQSEDLMKMKEWLHAIKLVINELNNPKDISPQQTSPHQSYSPTSPQPYQSEAAPRSPTRTSMKEKSLSPGKVFKSKSSVKRPKGKDEEEKKSIKSLLTILLKRRPDMETLVARGIMEGTVFGSKLVDLCKKERSSVPKFVKDCIATIERRGLDQDGLYRVSGNIAEIQKLRINIDNMSTNYHYNLDDECWDIHTLTGTLKLFFRELKEPLFPFNKFDKFLEIAKSESKMKVEDRLRNYKDLINSFPKCHKETLKELLQHLRKVISHSQQNRMQAQNIAIVFGPTLMWPEIEAPNLAISMAYQNRIVEFLLLEYEKIFC